jgi:hypothetical protein
MASEEDGDCWRTLVKAVAQLVVGGDEIDGSLCGWVVGGDGVDERGQGPFDAAKLLVE